jgi:predicted GNAT family N-acyltransferase
MTMSDEQWLRDHGATFRRKLIADMTRDELLAVARMAVIDQEKIRQRIDRIAKENREREQDI